MSPRPHPAPPPLRGSLEASALLFDSTLVGERLARERVLAAWTAGSSVRLTPEGWLLVFASPLRLASRRAPGLPFVARAGRLVAAEAEASALADWPHDAVASPRAGHWNVQALSSLPSGDPATWLDLSGFQVAAVESLGAAPAAPRSSVEELPDPDLRARLAVGAADPRAAEVARLLASGPEQATTPSRRFVDALDARLAGFVLALGSALRAATAWAGRTSAPATGRLARLLAHLRGRRAAAAPSAPAAPPRRGWLRRLLSKLVLEAGLGALLGRQHAAYIRRMMEMFERGDIKEALRHAIPLGKGGETGPLSWALPGPRFDLGLSLGGTQPVSAIGLGVELHASLTQLYRDAFRRLEAQGRVDEAAFVLAELLQAHEEAVAFLEAHGRLRLAAEMAEARGLAPGLVVRQWFLAGDVERALSIARRHGAFADAVARLERSGKRAEADSLRLRWADAAASAGDYAGAVDAAWPVREARALAEAWIERAIAVGGATGARMLVRKLELLPQAFEEIRDRVRELLADAEAGGLPARLAFATALSRLEAAEPGAMALARLAARTLARDAAIYVEAPDARKAFDRLVALSGEGALRADVPAWPGRRGTSLEQRGVPLELRWPLSDRGALALEDATVLPDGRVALALGEAGVRLVRANGRVIAHFDEPAHSLVASDNGDRLIALARRGETWRLARLDLVARRAARWCEATLDCWAESYDGAGWMVGSQGDLWSVDAAALRLDGPWRASAVLPSLIARNAAQVVCLTTPEGSGLQLWSYQQPSLRLRERRDLGLEPEEAVLAIAADGVVCTGKRSGESDRQVLLLRVLSPVPGAADVTAEALALHPGAAVLGAAMSASRVVLLVKWEADVLVAVLDRARLALRAALRLEGSTRARARVTDESIAVADDRGRLIVLDPQDGRVLHDLRT